MIAVEAFDPEPHTLPLPLPSQDLWLMSAFPFSTLISSELQQQQQSKKRSRSVQHPLPPSWRNSSSVSSTATRSSSSSSSGTRPLPVDVMNTFVRQLRFGGGSAATTVSTVIAPVLSSISSSSSPSGRASSQFHLVPSRSAVMALEKDRLGKRSFSPDSEHYHQTRSSEHQQKSNNNPYSQEPADVSCCPVSNTEIIDRLYKRSVKELFVEKQLMVVDSIRDRNMMSLSSSSDSLAERWVVQTRCGSTSSSSPFPVIGSRRGTNDESTRLLQNMPPKFPVLVHLSASQRLSHKSLLAHKDAPQFCMLPLSLLLSRRFTASSPPASQEVHSTLRIKTLSEELVAFLENEAAQDKRARMQALADHNPEAYLDHLSSLKISSLLTIMEKTHDFMIKIGAKLESRHIENDEQAKAKASTDHKSLKTGLQSAASSEGVFESAEYLRFKAYVASTKDEYKLIHKNVAFVERQPNGLNADATLMPHQMDGLRFLYSLHENGINGILADEMGVGKTLQTLSFFMLLKELRLTNNNSHPLHPNEKKGKATHPLLPPRQSIHLVLAPLSIVREWKEAAETFFRPGHLCIREFPEFLRDDSSTSANAAAGTKSDGPDIVLLALHRVRAFERELQTIEWDYVVVDEAHKAVSNLETLTAQAILSIPHRHRLVLTGTPLNSDLQELWSLLHFLNPDIFSERNSFEDVFRRPFQGLPSKPSGGTEKSQRRGGKCRKRSATDVAEAESEESNFARKRSAALELTLEERELLVVRMHQILRPFMLRRTKKDIDKTLRMQIHKVICPLSLIQSQMLTCLRERRVVPRYFSSVDSSTTLVDGKHKKHSKRKLRRQFAESILHLMRDVRQKISFEQQIANNNMSSASMDIATQALTNLPYIPGPKSVTQSEYSILYPSQDQVNGEDDGATSMRLEGKCRFTIVMTREQVALNLCNHPLLLPFFSQLIARSSSPLPQRLLSSPVKPLRNASPTDTHTENGPLRPIHGEDSKGLPSDDQPLSSQSIDLESLLLRSSGKFVVLDFMLRRIEQLGQKVVIFTHWLECIELLKEYFAVRGWAEGEQFVVLTGANSAEERKECVLQFRTSPTWSRMESANDDRVMQNREEGGHMNVSQPHAASNDPHQPSNHAVEIGPKKRGVFIFLVSIKAGGCGLNLQCSHLVIMLDKDYTMTNEDQALARVFRIGQKNTVHAFYLLTEDCAEARVCEISGNKDKPRLAIIENGGYHCEAAICHENEGENTKEDVNNTRPEKMDEGDDVDNAPHEDTTTTNTNNNGDNNHDVLLPGEIKLPATTMNSCVTEIAPPPCCAEASSIPTRPRPLSPSLRDIGKTSSDVRRALKSDGPFHSVIDMRDVGCLASRDESATTGHELIRRHENNNNKVSQCMNLFDSLFMPDGIMFERLKEKDPHSTDVSRKSATTTCCPTTTTMTSADQEHPSTPTAAAPKDFVEAVEAEEEHHRALPVASPLNDDDGAAVPHRGDTTLNTTTPKILFQGPSLCEQHDTTTTTRRHNDESYLEQQQHIIKIIPSTPPPTTTITFPEQLIQRFADVPLCIQRGLLECWEDFLLTPHNHLSPPSNTMPTTTTTTALIDDDGHPKKKPPQEAPVVLTTDPSAPPTLIDHGVADTSTRAAFMTLFQSYAQLLQEDRRILTVTTGAREMAQSLEHARQLVLLNNEMGESDGDEEGGDEDFTFAFPSDAFWDKHTELGMDDDEILQKFRSQLRQQRDAQRAARKEMQDTVQEMRCDTQFFSCGGGGNEQKNAKSKDVRDRHDVRADKNVLPSEKSQHLAEQRTARCHEPTSLSTVCPTSATTTTTVLNTMDREIAQFKHALESYVEACNEMQQKTKACARNKPAPIVPVRIMALNRRVQKISSQLIQRFSRGVDDVDDDLAHGEDEKETD